MKLLTEAEQVRTAAERWRKNYFLQGQGWVALQDGRNSGDVHEQLLRMDPALGSEGVVAIVGDDNLVHAHRCSECGLMFWYCVAFKSGGTILCSKCMCAGLSLALGVSAER